MLFSFYSRLILVKILFKKMSDIIEETTIEDQPTPVDLEGTKMILSQMKNCICKIVKDNGEKGTGFFSKIQFPDKNNLLNVLITNNHVLNENDIENDKIIKFIIYNKEKKKEEQKEIRIDNSRKKLTIKNDAEGIDITMIEIKEKDEINTFLEIDDDILELNCKRKSIYILHYPEEKRLVSYGLMNDILDDKKINHYCNTQDGSSGSPILSLSNFKVIGVHYGWSKNKKVKLNFGTFIKYATNEFKNKYIIENKDEYNEEKTTNEIIVKYQIGKENRIRIFGDTFVKNNKSNFQMIINNNQYELDSFYTIKNEKENEILKVKLKKLKKPSDLSYMFSECFSLAELSDISNLNTNEVTDMSFMFNGCSNLTSLPDISKWNINNVNNLKYMFSECSSLTELPDISKWNTNKVTDMSFIFCECSELSSLPDISKWNINNVTDVESMFNECSKISSLPDISKWNTNKVTNMKTMFQGCSSLTQLPDISKWNTNEVTDMSYMFSSCYLLSSLPDISKWNTNKVTDMNCMFADCRLLSSFPDISKWNTNNVTNHRNIFYGCFKLYELPNIFK